MAENEWYPPEPPDLPDGDRLIVNFETTGLDWRGGAKPLAVAVHQPASGRSWYLPFGHRGPRNLDEEQVKRWAKEQLRNRRIDNANTKFELHMGRSWGVDLDEAGCTFGDVQHYAALLDDARYEVNLDSLIKTELGEQPMARLDESRMAEWRSQDAAPRAMYGVEAVERVLKTFRPRLAEEGLEEVAALEDAVIPAVVEMEHNGAPIDVDKCVAWQRETYAEIDELHRQIATAIGRKLQEALFEGGRRDSGYLNAHSGKQMVELYEKLGIEPERGAPTEAHPDGNPRFDSEALELHEDHPVIALIIRQKRLEDLDSKYFKPYLKRIDSNGILPYQLHQTRGDEKGTRRGRFSASDVNIQQVMKAKKQAEKYGAGRIIRELFLPARGRLFVSCDAAQIEYRIFAHLAKNPDILKAYANEDPTDPKTWLNFHKKSEAMVCSLGKFIDYDKAKTLSFLTIYGGGLAKLALQLKFITKKQHADLTREYKDKKYGVPRDHPLLRETLKIKKAYEKAIPEVGPLSKQARELAAERGWVKDFLGRRARFPGGKGAHGALNAVIQPGAAEVMKKKIVAVHKMRHAIGVTPRMTIHDDWLGDCDGQESARQLGLLMNEQEYEFRVKILWDVKASWRNWAACGPVEDQHEGMHLDPKNIMQPEEWKR